MSCVSLNYCDASADIRLVPLQRVRQGEGPRGEPRRVPPPQGGAEARAGDGRVHELDLQSRWVITHFTMLKQTHVIPVRRGPHLVRVPD